MASPLASSSRVRASYVAISVYIRRTLSTTATSCSSDRFRRSDFANQPFTGTYDADQPTGGPLGELPIMGSPRLTPKLLKQHLDQFVVGQERAKKVMAVAVFNHYQRIAELRRREEEEHQFLQQRLRRERANPHPVEGEQTDTVKDV